MPAFCSKCGKKTIKEPTGEYRDFDGEMIDRDICPDICLHGNHLLGDYVRQWFIVRLFRGPKRYCLRCKQAIPVIEYSLFDY